MKFIPASVTSYVRHMWEKVSRQFQRGNKTIYKAKISHASSANRKGTRDGNDTGCNNTPAGFMQ